MRQHTVKVGMAAHTMAAKLSNKFGLSMAAVVELGLRELASRESITIPARDPRSKKSNARKVLRKAVAA
jgi:hypothetical protein